MTTTRQDDDSCNLFPSCAAPGRATLPTRCVVRRGKRGVSWRVIRLVGSRTTQVTSPESTEGNIKMTSTFFSHTKEEKRAPNRALRKRPPRLILRDDSEDLGRDPPDSPSDVDVTLVAPCRGSTGSAPRGSPNPKWPAPAANACQQRLKAELETRARCSIAAHPRRREGLRYSPLARSHRSSGTVTPLVVVVSPDDQLRRRVTWPRQRLTASALTLL